MTERLSIEVIYPLPSRQEVLRVHVPPGASVRDAIEASGVLEKYPEIDLAKNKVGIYSRPAKLHERVQDGDRVEIYRPLIADPKALRRQRAEKGAGK